MLLNLIGTKLKVHYTGWPTEDGMIKKVTVFKLNVVFQLPVSKMWTFWHCILVSEKNTGPNDEELKKKKELKLASRHFPLVSTSSISAFVHMYVRMYSMCV